MWLELGAARGGHKQAIHYFQSRAECNWLAAEDPTLWRRTRHFLFLSGYFHLKLTGQLRDAVASQVGYVPFDGKLQRWAAKRDLKWKLFCVKREVLPELVPAGQSIGGVTAEAALQTGIPEGLPVYASGADKACEVFAAGAWTPELAVLSYGTTATINTCNSRYVEPVPSFRPIPPRRRTLQQRDHGPARLLDGQLVQGTVRGQRGDRSEKKGVAPEVLFERMLETTPPGNMGLILQPFWNPGVRIPGPEAKGAMIGFGDVHNRAHMYRAIVEGIAFALREAAARLERRNGVKIERLKVAGGGSQSDGVMQTQPISSASRPSGRTHSKPQGWAPP